MHTPSSKVLPIIFQLYMFSRLGGAITHLLKEYRVSGSKKTSEDEAEIFIQQNILGSMKML